MPRVGTDPQILARPWGAHAAIPALGLAAFDPHFRDVGAGRGTGAVGGGERVCFLRTLGCGGP